MTDAKAKTELQAGDEVFTISEDGKTADYIGFKDSSELDDGSLGERIGRWPTETPDEDSDEDSDDDEST